MSRGLAFAALAVAAMALPASAAAAQPAAAAAQQDWSRTVAVTPEGGFRMGNPNAKVKLVEYGSMTCPHCAEFAAGAKGPLAAHVRSGKVSFEFRNFVLNAADLAASLLTRCSGTRGFFRLTEALFASQPQWVGKIAGLTAQQKEQLKGLSREQQLARVAELAGLTQMAAQAGVTPARANQCLTDPAGVQRLGQMSEAAAALGVQGTPTFFINGAMIHAHDWAELEPLIRQAGG